MPSHRCVLALSSAVLVLGGSAGCREPKDLSVEQLQAVVDAQRPTLKPCYDEALQQHPYKQEMRMQVVIQVAKDGRVAAVDVEKGSGLPGMPACLKRAIGAWRFPEAPDETHASLPLVFKPEVKPLGVPDLPRLDEILGAQREKQR